MGKQLEYDYDPSTGIPKGWWPLNAYSNGEEIVVMGTPTHNEELAEDAPEQHDCDEMGCGSDHVLARFRVPRVRRAQIEAQRDRTSGR